MGIVTTFSPSITGLNASPIVVSAMGEGAAGMDKIANDQVTAVSGDSIGSIYKFCRIPTNAKLKRLFYASAVQGGGAADIDIAYSDSKTDGTPQNFINLTGFPIVQFSGPADNKVFGAAQSLVQTLATNEFIEVTFKNTFTPLMQNQPLWQALVSLGTVNFTTDPGGFFDIVMKLTTGVTTGGVISMLAQYVE
jgi:hypothetical protein